MIIKKTDSDFSQIAILFIEVKNSLHSSDALFSDEIQIQEPLVVLLQLLRMIWKLRKNFFEPDSSKSPRRKNNNLTDPEFLFSIIVPLTPKPSSKPVITKDVFLRSQLSIEQFQFKSQLTSFFVASTPCTFQFNPNRYNDH